MGYEVIDHILYKDGEKVPQHPSPNHEGEINPEIAVIHYTGTNGLVSPLSWLCDKQSGVSAHLLIDTNGDVYQLLPFNVKAWHAGVSSYNGRSGVNSFSIGIENVGIGDLWPDAQVNTIRDVLSAISAAYDIQDIVGHEDVAPGRKSDPGPNFPWGKVTATPKTETTEESAPAPTVPPATIVQPGGSGEVEPSGGNSGQFKPDEIALARKYLPVIRAAADVYKWPPELDAQMAQSLGPRWMDWILLAIGSRESRLGLLLDADGLGDGGHGHGIFQIDDRSYPEFCARDDWRTLEGSLPQVHKVLVSFFNTMGESFDLFADYGDLFRATLSAYNAGAGGVLKAVRAGAPPDSVTTGRDYADDVMKRARAFKEVLG